MKRAIVMDRLPNSPSGKRRIRVALWFPVPTAGRQAFYSNPTRASAVKTATAPEQADYAAGKFVEEVHEIEVDELGTPAQTTSAAQAQIQDLWQARWDVLSAEDPARNYGRYWVEDDVSKALSWGGP